MPEETGVIAYAARKVPIAMFVGTRDPLVPVEFVRAARDALAGAGIPVQLTEIPGHTHNYYERSKEINHDAWAFLTQHELPRDPHYSPLR